MCTCYSADVLGYDEPHNSFSRHRPSENQGILVNGRPESIRPRSADEPVTSSLLDVPIPHGRLGRFILNGAGSPALRSSAYTRGSLPDRTQSFASKKSSITRFKSAVEAAASARTLSESMFAPLHESSEITPTITPTPVYYRLESPIDPSIFDTLVPDDPAVVRYVPGSRDICAATPARIIAEISSDSFMDYELVSDFFLTYRSYMSSTDLLALLLARLGWAVYRQEEDGRIIRIRVFAAIRHWILNYFVDDFVTSHDLRSRFCDQLNEIYTKLKSREGTKCGDLKILVDLKRCWNGKCSLFWGTEVDDANPNRPISPGGAAENYRETYPFRFSNRRSSNYVPVGAVGSASSDSANCAPTVRAATKTPDHPNISDSPSKWITKLPMGHRRPEGTSYGPSKSSERGDFLQTNRRRGFHPPLFVSTNQELPPGQKSAQLPPTPASAPVPTAPTWWRRGHSHQRSGSFSDSLRDDRSPAPASGRASRQFVLPSAEDIIQGHVYAPVEQAVRVFGPPSQAVETPAFESQSSGLKAWSPGVKQLIGNIYRVLNKPSGSVGLGSLPSEISDPLGVKHNNTPRIDILGEQAALAYQGHFTSESLASAKDSWDGDQAGQADELKKRPALPPLSPAFRASQRVLPNPRDPVPSQITTGSKSIVIVDDTGLMPPVPDLPPIKPSARSSAPNVPVSFDSPAKDSGSLTVQYRPAGPPPAESSPLSLLTEEQPHEGHSLDQSFEFSANGSILINPPVSRDRPQSVKAVSNKLRKYASEQSALSSFRDHSNIDKTTAALVEGPPQSERQHRSFNRMLRRRPSGDLRQARNVKDLKIEKDTRDRAFTTLSLEDSSVSLDPLSSHETSAHEQGKPSEGGETSAVSTDLYSYVESSPSRQGRPSFEEAVAKFSGIPDDTDGGVESALLKLEGKWEPPSGDRRQLETSSSSADQSLRHSDGDQPKLDVHHHHVNSTTNTTSLGRTKKASTCSSGSVECLASEESYCSDQVPYRGISDEYVKKRAPSTLRNLQVPRCSTTGKHTSSDYANGSAGPSTYLTVATDGSEHTPRESTVPESRLSDSFVSDTRQTYVSGVSSDPSVDSGRDTTSQFVNVSTLSPKPLSPLVRNPPSPPPTVAHNGTATPTNPLPLTSEFQQPPITPRSSPEDKKRTVPRRDMDMSCIRNVPNLPNNILLTPETEPPSLEQLSTIYRHTPFILAFDCKVLAEQFTLVEKAALNEVDWSDLVEMRWSHGSQCTLNWAHYLFRPDIKGIDIVVARFNLMVKWVISEILLTRCLNERVQVIVQFIYIATFAYKIRNFSTMLQITIALCSIDSTRLKKTWAAVPDNEKRLLRDMEFLIQPLRNFHNLRVEMEQNGLQDGCIPFVGLYIQDLTYNSQKPAQVPGKTGALLFNFERYRTAATIIKNVLKLIDASTRYNYEPVHGIIERCLWISALDDDNVAILSRSAEKGA